MITLSSIFRNSAAYIPRYFKQVAALREQTPVRLVIGEGDSVDETVFLLNRYTDDGDQIVTVNHGGPHYSSIDLPARWAQIAQVINGVTAQIKDPGDAFLWVEADLIWDADTMMALLAADRPVAPMVFASDFQRFYDVWGFRQGGFMFEAMPPYFPLGRSPERYTKIDSCGSCFAMPANEFHRVREWDGMWPFAAGGGLWADTESSIRHP